MNIVRKIVRETLLVPIRVVQGVVDAASETVKIATGDKCQHPNLQTSGDWAACHDCNEAWLRGSGR